MKKHYFRFLRYSNLSSELKKYGYVYTPKKAIISYGICLSIAVVIGMMYKLSFPYVACILLSGILALPKILIQTNQYRYNLNMFSSTNSYIEQMMYSFKRNSKILASLEDTLSIFPEGEVHDVINDAIVHIRFSVSEEDVEQEAVKKLAEFFRCERVNNLHELVLIAQRRGGDYSMSVNLLLKDRSLWADRVYLMQKEVKTVRRNIVIALIISLLLCLLPMYILPGILDISTFAIYRISALAMILSCLLIYIKADKKLCISWVSKEEIVKKNMQEKYLQVINFDEAKESRTSKIMVGIAVLITGIAFSVFRKEYILVIGLAIAGFCLNQHKIGHKLAKASIERDITKHFPKWLMDVALLLQTDNVQISIRRSYENAPDVLKPALDMLINELVESPNEIEPYIHFLSEFTLPDVQSAMKMLYSLSAGNGGDSDKQISELIERNFSMLDKAEKLSSEDKLAGMQIYILLPSLLASFKLMLDMALLMVVFLGNLTIGI